MNEYYKYEEIQSYFQDWIKDQDKNWIEENIDDLHHHCFNTDYYIIGRYEAKKWLSNNVFEIIEIIKNYEQDNFGEITTDFSEPEKVVNMYVYIAGQMIVDEYREQLENKKEVAQSIDNITKMTKLKTKQRKEKQNDKICNTR